MCLIHFNSIIQPFSLALTFWKNGETLKLFSMVFSGTYAPLTSCFPHHIWALVDQMLRSMDPNDPRSHLEESMKPWFLIWRELLWTQDFLWDAYFSCFFPQDVAMWHVWGDPFLGHLWWKWLDELRFSTASGAPWQHLMPFGSFRNRITGSQKNTTKSAEAPMLSQGLERCTSWFLSLDFPKKTAELRDIPWCLAEF